jgi:hypothetical protein
MAISGAAGQRGGCIAEDACYILSSSKSSIAWATCMAYTVSVFIAILASIRSFQIVSTS